MPSAAEYAASLLDPTHGGAANAAGLLSLQRAAEAGTAAAAGASSGAGLFGFDPASIAFSLFVNSILNKKPLLTETPMTPEEAALYSGQERLNTTFGGVGEGAGELILDAIEQARAAGVTQEEIAATLNNANIPEAALINLTVGSNQMLSDADLAAAQAASQAAADAAASGATSVEDLTNPTNYGLVVNANNTFIELEISY